MSMLPELKDLMVALYQEGGYIILGIFALSIYLYHRIFSLILDAQHAESNIRSELRSLEEERRKLDSMEVDKVSRKFSNHLNGGLLNAKVLIAAAPLLGLLGTIIGMVDTFDAISATVGADASTVVSKGISKALLTTSAGLVVALPALLMTVLVRRKAGQIDIEIASLRAAVLKQKRRVS